MKRIKVISPGDNLARRGLGGKQSKEITTPLYYDDSKVVHACESYFMHAGPPVERTMCDIEVPLNGSFTVDSGTIEVTCRKCRAEAA
jgi:hypothetical protein